MRYPNDFIIPILHQRLASFSQSLSKIIGIILEASTLILHPQIADGLCEYQEVAATPLGFDTSNLFNNKLCIQQNATEPNLSS